MNISFKRYALSILALVSCAQSVQVRANTTLSGSVNTFMDALKAANPGPEVMAACLLAPAVAGLSKMANDFYYQANIKSIEATNPKDRAKAIKIKQRWATIHTVINAIVPVALAVSIPAAWYSLLRLSTAYSATRFDMGNTIRETMKPSNVFVTSKGKVVEVRQNYTCDQTPADYKA